MIRTAHLTKHYDQLVALSNLNLDVPWGQLYGFLGPNGAGKTTTIKLLCGLLRPTEGTILVGDVDIQKNPMEAKKQIGYIPDSPYLYEKLTAWEFLHFVGKLYGMPKTEIDAKGEEYMERLGIAEWKHRLVQDFSHGMRQRVVFSAAFLHNPKILIVDEPMVGLDPQSARMVKDLFRNLARQGGTVFVSTHTLSLAEELCDRIGIIQNGSMIVEGTVEELKQRADMQGALEDIFLELTKEEKAVHPPVFS